MNKLQRVLLTVCAFSFVMLAAGLSNAWAEAESPDAIVKKLIVEMQKEKNASPIVNYLDPETIFNDLPAAHRKAMNIKSQADVVDHFRKILKDPGSLVREMFSKMPTGNGQGAAMQQMRASMEAMIAQKQKEMEDRIVNSTYEVGSSKIEGDTAVVPLTHTYKGEVKTNEISFIKKNGKWLLPSIAPMQESIGAKAKLNAAPAGLGGGMPPGALAPQ